MADKTGNCICCGRNNTRYGYTYCDECIDDFQDDDNDSDDFDQERFEENKIQEILRNCNCGAYYLSNEGKLMMCADCDC